MIGRVVPRFSYVVLCMCHSSWLATALGFDLSASSPIRPGSGITGSAESRSWSRLKAATFPTRPYDCRIFHVGLIQCCVRIPTTFSAGFDREARQRGETMQHIDETVWLPPRQLFSQRSSPVRQETS